MIYIATTVVLVGLLLFALFYEKVIDFLVAIVLSDWAYAHRISERIR